MSQLNLDRYAMSVCAIAALLQGCGGGRGVVPQTDTVALPTVLQRQSHELDQLASGGAFSANYSGTNETTHKGGTREVLLFNGTGKASFIGPSEERGKFHLYCKTVVCGFVRGRFWLISKRHPQDVVIMSVKMNREGSAYVYRVTGGSGRFANAMGSGTWSSTMYGTKGTYTDQWSGTLYY